MAAHRRAARPYRGQKMRARPVSTSPVKTPRKSVDFASPLALVATDIDLHFWDHEPRLPNGRWTDNSITDAWIGGGKDFLKIRNNEDPTMVDAFEDMLGRQPAHIGELWRGTTEPDFASLKVGDEFEWKRPTSSTSALATAERFGSKDGGRPTLFRIATGAAKVLPGQERLVTMHEAVIPPGRFRVIGRSTIALDHGGPRMRALHPNAPTEADVIDLEDITPAGPRPFVPIDVAPPRPKHRGRPHLLQLARPFGEDIDLVVHDVSKEARDPAGRWTHLKGTFFSISQQGESQRHAERAWQSATGGYNFEDDIDDTLNLDPSDPAAGWAYYQSQAYGPINKFLRTGEDTDMGRATGGDLRTNASVIAASTIKAFDTMGYTTTKPMTLFRVESGAHTDKVENFHVGDTFVEKGVVSAAANPDEVAGFLDDNLQGSKMALGVADRGAGRHPRARRLHGRHRDDAQAGREVQGHGDHQGRDRPTSVHEGVSTPRGPRRVAPVSTLTVTDPFERIADGQLEPVDEDDDEADLANPTIRRTRLAANQLLDGMNPVTMLRRRGVSTPVAQAVQTLISRGTSTRPNARLYGHRLTLPIRLERDREALYRGGYYLKAAERMQAAVDAGTPTRDALLTERRYFDLHEKARAGRLDAVTEAQRAGAWFGQEVRVAGTTRHLVGWYLNPLLNNDPECVAANRHNFYAEEGTLIGFPGAVHLNCGCYAGEPIPGAAMVNDVLRAQNVLPLPEVGREPTYALSRKRKIA